MSDMNVERIDLEDLASNIEKAAEGNFEGKHIERLFRAKKENIENAVSEGNNDAKDGIPSSSLPSRKAFVYGGYQLAKALAPSFKGIREMKKELENAMNTLRVKLTQANKNTKMATERCDAFFNLYTECNSKLEAVESAVEKIEAALNIRAETENPLEKRIEKIAEVHEGKLTEIATAVDITCSSVTQVSDITGAVGKLKEQIKEAEKQMNKDKDAIARLEKLVQSLTASLQEKTREVEKLRQEFDGICNVSAFTINPLGSIDEGEEVYNPSLKPLPVKKK
ncbi:MAG: hypothetical protein LBB18_00600 [Puniceicoccales bacterium]|jgi:chromosome segregation ATPase|nr:hypothetical protein [Puniceicoccales bacterium]